MTTSRRPGSALVIALVAIALLCAVAIEAMARGLVYGFDYWRTDYRVNADGYAGAPWVADYYEEFRASANEEWQPYVYWRRPAYKGRYINVDAKGVRRSWRDPAAGQPRIFMMGGSTVWGTGARDEFTLPSEIAKQLSTRGVRATVVNYGESGYVTAQSVALLLTLLRRGEVPDLVVFYGGVEDVYSAFQNGVAGIPQNEVHRRLEFNATQPYRFDKLFGILTSGTSRMNGLLLQRPSAAVAASAPTEAGTSGLASDVIDQICSNARLAAALGREYGFSVQVFWQPVIFTKPLLTPYERREAIRVSGVRSLFEETYRLVAARPGCHPREFYDVSRVFDGEAGPRFVDAMHLTEDGTRDVASVMLPAIAGALDR